jgi:glutathione synthase/RimK-type ligase-like ATP-grasp enzyme
VEWLDLASGLIVNRPAAMESNSSKPFQSQAIAKAGFAVPDTLVTNDPADVQEFWRRHKRVIFKSISGIRSIVQELTPVNVQRLERVKRLPTQFQAYVPGIDIRVHVVGERLFATQVDSAATDYRYAGQEGLETTLKEVALPDRIGAQCIALARRLDLPFCGIDLRRTPEGEYVCFEVNPMPAYSYYEAGTGQAISQAMVELLARNNNCMENYHGAIDREPDQDLRDDLAAKAASPAG